MTTNITLEHRRAFEAIRGTADNIALFSCFFGTTPTTAIVAITETEDGDIQITPIFVAITDDMVLTDHKGIPPRASGAVCEVQS